jgi:PadR family transcriptional regulator
VPDRSETDRRTAPTDLLRGTLDLLILRSLAPEALHGLGISRRIAAMTRGTFDVKPGSLFPALYRLEERGLVKGRWGESETRRRAKFYELTARGRRELEVEEAQWRRVALAMTQALESS